MTDALFAWSSWSLRTKEPILGSPDHSSSSQPGPLERQETARSFDVSPSFPWEDLNQGKPQDVGQCALTLVVVMLSKLHPSHLF